MVYYFTSRCGEYLIYMGKVGGRDTHLPELQVVSYREKSQVLRPRGYPPAYIILSSLMNNNGWIRSNEGLGCEGIDCFNLLRYLLLEMNHHYHRYYL